MHWGCIAITPAWSRDIAAPFHTNETLALMLLVRGFFRGGVTVGDAVFESDANDAGAASRVTLQADMSGWQ